MNCMGCSRKQAKRTTDELLGEQQVVIKPLPTYLNSFGIKEAGIVGCTILGDGNISLILDVASLLTSNTGFAGY